MLILYLVNQKYCRDVPAERLDDRSSVLIIVREYIRDLYNNNTANSASLERLNYHL
ncbi:hypothetical protein [[Scytonema hofmanni] UTEX B 1581]|jgi:hypothetical protein|uniref:hypothetical protein n=1 Tax=[Scytonema hofmanni] UTEX B 1581 TaxID=379535 RepID=UPI00163E49D6|nr:hypothetical protein [[Scytonema hofmanni] UTEX B 1581]